MGTPYSTDSICAVVWRSSRTASACMGSPAVWTRCSSPICWRTSGLPDTPDCVINPVQMACGLLQLTGGGVQCEAVAHPLGGVTASSSRTERSEMVAWAMISHTWTGTIVFVFMFSFLFDSVFGSVCYCQTRCSFAVGKAIQQTHRTFCCGFAYD